MSKITKHAEFLDTLRGMVTKEASQPTASGVPGKDTQPAKTPESTEHVNKNEQGKPETNPQEVKQEKGKDAPLHGKSAEDKEAAAKVTMATPPDTAAPVAAKEVKDTKATQTEAPVAKKAEDTSENLKLAELGAQLLEAIKLASQPTATGIPGKDTHPAKVDESTEHVNKNEQGKPETNPQQVKQEKGKDAPLHGKSAADQEEIDKVASFELGRQFCRSFLQTKVASQEQIYKEAGRKDFETLIAQAAAELDNTQKQAQQQQQEAQQVKQASALYDEQYAEKQAEEAGSQAFYAMMKQAQEEYQAEQIKVAFEQQLNALLVEKQAFEKKAIDLEAALKDKEAAMQKKADEEKRASEMASWSNYVVDQVITRLQSEAAR